jgi:hypothetical protein
MPYGPPANRLLFENEQTRVWEMLVQPGESFPMHSHEYPYLSLNMETAVTSSKRTALKGGWNLNPARWFGATPGKLTP